MNDDGLHVILALLPQGTTGDVHSTLVDCGTTDTAIPEQQLFNICQSLARFAPPVVSAFVVRHALFGPMNDEPVALLEGAALRALRAPVDWLANSQWGYAPHISVQDNYPLPAVGENVFFDRVGLWFAERRYNFQLGTGVRRAP